jgi:3-methylcrotonyl-CoA carboxylase beta subunit
MATIKSKINPNSADFAANAAAMQAQVDDLHGTLDRVRQGGGSKACERHTSRGKLLPRERVQGLLDPGSPFLELSALGGPQCLWRGCASSRNHYRHWPGQWSGMRDCCQ